MGTIANLALAMGASYSEQRLIEILKETDNEILQDVGKQAMDEEGFPNWVKLASVDYVVDLVSSYTFEEWAALAKAIFNIRNIESFVENEMYILFEEFLGLFNIHVNIRTQPEDLETEMEY
ncbi:hypothetical protein [Staphylococcus succinus]|uniref:hypothetical protein n=1 Tax=Staphylococcus succinus TaxID=61015 RepID=UPI000E693CE8|nr:hypothetical protein [Staphylococcus succinus]RIN27703.1 hypothetical protein BU067_01470 [Staphylococcus succinus]